MVSLADVARDARVSTATVSRVLNNSARVRPTTRERVLASVKKLGYVPNVIARSLASGRTMTLAMAYDDLPTPFLSRITAAVADASFKEGYQLMPCLANQSLEREAALFRDLAGRQVDGVVVSAVSRTETDLTPLIEADIPVVLVTHLVEGFDLDSVTLDAYGGAYTAVSHLITRGYRRIATVAGPQTRSGAIGKLEGYRKALLDHHMSIPEGYVLFGDYTEEDGERLASALLDLAKPPDAVLVANERMTMGLLRVVRERGLRIPRDLGIVGFNDFGWPSLLTPPLTMVAQPIRDLGETAVRMLLERICGEYQGPPRHVVLPTRLMRRRSC